MNILELLKPSDKIALIQDKKRVSYSALLSEGLRLGGRLRREEIGVGNHVLVFTPLSIELYVAMIGAWSVGAVPIFIDFSRGVEFVNRSIDRLRPDIVICDNVTMLMRNIYGRTRKIKAINVNHGREPVVVEKLNSEHPAILTFTSGTTGVPKIAVRTHGFLINQYNVLKRHFDFCENNIDLGTLPIFILANLASNMTTLLPSKSYKSKINASKLASKVDMEKVTRIICSPALISNLLKHSDLHSLKSLYLGGAPVYPTTLAKIRSNVDLNIVYGSTEAEPIARVRWADVAIDDRERIANGAGLLVGTIVSEIAYKIGTGSEILVSGETVINGYLDGIGDNENKIREGNTTWHRTGDAGYIDEQGRLWLLGRVNQAIHDDKGALYPFCTECMLDAHFGIRGAIFARNGERVVAIEKGSISPQDVLQVLKSQKISRVVLVDKIPMDKRHGAKIDYSRLEADI